jgi:hypothetical protein
VGSEGSFLVEDFINAITTQLDRVQDALRLKAVNRPLTYALKDIALDLQVFVEVDAQGNVRFRSSGANETGASTIRLGFTTITKPMIEENTISLAMSTGAHLEDMGLDDEEKRRLEQLGVRNAAQLQELRKSTDTKTVARLSGIPVDRLREALALGKPQVTQVVPSPPKPTPKPVSPKPTTPPVKPQPPVTPKPPVAQPGQPKPPVFVPPKQTPPVFVPPKTPPVVKPPVVPKPKPAAPPIKLPLGTKHLSLLGSNFSGAAPEVRLNNRPLNIADLEDDYLTVEMPDEAESGALEIILPDGEQMTYELSYEDEDPGYEVENFDYENEDAASDAEESISRSRYESRAADVWEPEY